MKKFITFISLLALLLACLLLAFLVVWPLWKFAIGSPKVYTWTILGIMAALLIFLIVKKIIKKNEK
ncbi:MAG: hypothetical protein K5866_07570 [Treponema sp.]|nr:hypothetical protein [Treponema sp.]